MATDVVMPQMGESIAEGTIVRWIKRVGESVERDEPLFEISTDKVDAEIPSPVAGVVTEIRAKEGETVPVNSVVAVIGAPGSAASVTPSQPTPVTSSQPTPLAPAEPASRSEGRDGSGQQRRRRDRRPGLGRVRHAFPTNARHVVAAHATRACGAGL